MVRADHGAWVGRETEKANATYPQHGVGVGLLGQRPCQALCLLTAQALRDWLPFPAGAGRSGAHLALVQI